MLRRHLREALILLTTTILALAVSEFALRSCLFSRSCPVTSIKNALYYAHYSTDEYWIYTYYFTPDWRIDDRSKPTSAGSTHFYDNWPLSLKPDTELGYVRKAGVHTPCHETTALGTRGVHEYPSTGKKIVFFGDSFVESATCSDESVTSYLEKASGIDVLNYGVGGYGFDQIYLLWHRNWSNFDPKTSLFLIGLVIPDFDRTILKVRTSPKPYFTIAADTLVLHTDHIHQASLNDYFDFHKPRRLSYLYLLLKARFDRFPALDARTEIRQQKLKADVTRLIVQRIRTIREREGLNLAFVIFPTSGDYRRGSLADSSFAELARQHGIGVVDLVDCLPSEHSEIRFSDLYERHHPTPLANSILAKCLVDELSDMDGFEFDLEAGVSPP